MRSEETQSHSAFGMMVDGKVGGLPSIHCGCRRRYSVSQRSGWLYPPLLNFEDLPIQPSKRFQLSTV